MGKFRKLIALVKEYGLATAFQMAVAKLTTAYYFQRKKAVALVKKSLRDEKTQSMERNHKFHTSPKISILTPVYNTDEGMLKSVIESVIGQTYPNWELCIADGSDENHNVVEDICRSYMEKDSRILYQKLEQNLGISGNTNVTMDMATGSYFALLDHDDLLHPSALFRVVKAIESGADFIYTDEITFRDKPWNVISTNLKPDFAPDMLYANNYICHLSVFSRELADAAGGFRQEYDGSQDHDLILRLTAKAEHIIHIPEILYFWRAHPGSVVEDIQAKSYAIDAGIRAVQDHLSAQGYQVQVRSSDIYPTIYKTDYIVPDLKISIIILNHNHCEDLKRLLDSLKQCTYKNYEILILENNSDDADLAAYYESLRQNPQVKVLEQHETFNYSAFNNYAASQASGGLLLFMNNDMEVIAPSFLEEMAMFAARPNTGAVGARLFYGNHTLQHCFVVTGLGEDGIAIHAGAGLPEDDYGYLDRIAFVQNVTAVTGACLMVRREAFLEVGGFDENLAVAYNDVDLCLKLRKQGYLNVYTPYATLFHYESSSRGSDWETSHRDRLRTEIQYMKNKWMDQLEDPYYNPTFSKSRAYTLR